MGLCSLCQSVDFNNLPPLPAHYETYHTPWKKGSGLLAFISPRLGETHKAGKDTDEGDFSQPLGAAHHQSIEELTAAAQDCPPCRLIEREVSGHLATLAEAEKDDVYSYYQKKRNNTGPNYRLWLTRRRDDCEGFLVVSPGIGRRAEVWLLAGIGFCVEGTYHVTIIQTETDIGRTDDDPLSNEILGRVIEEDPATEKTLARAVKYVHECDLEHVGGRCSVGDVNLPNRILDITSGTSANKVKLVEPCGAHGKYTALSHRWGKSITPFATTRTNLEVYRESILIEDLPKSFQDAIIVTRRLGLRYLWIDALSICQDDGPEWERESSMMASIYADAYLVIAATGTTNDHQGLFFSRTLPVYESFEYSKNGVTGTINAFAISKDGRAAEKSIYCDMHEQPLSARSWVLQERILASRTLHFASEQIFFECDTHARSEDGFKMSGRLNDIHQEAKPRSQKSSDRNSGDALFRGSSFWYLMLWDYSKRRLTKSSDKLPALSGLARIVGGQLGDKYVAGLWRSTLLEGMLWQAVGTHHGATSAPPEYRAPSWSWASIDGLAANLGLGKQATFIREEPKPEWIDVGTVLDCHVELKGENPYGEVTSGWVRIRAPLEPLSPSEEPEPDHETVSHKRNLRMKTRTGKPFGAYCMLDTMSEEAASKLSLFALPLVLKERKRTGRSIQALMIMPVEEQPDHYRRVGKIIFDSESIGSCDWLKDPTQMETVTLL
jgi:hypothetical protein